MSKRNTDFIYIGQFYFSLEISDRDLEKKKWF